MKKNILIFVGRIKKGGGGVDVWAIEIGRKLHELGYNITYLTINDYKKDNYDHVGKYYSLYENRQSKKNSVFKKIKNLFYRSIFLKKIVKENNIDVIISGGGGIVPNVNALFAKLLGLKSKVIVSIHNNLEKLSFFDKSIYRIFFKFADHIVTVSKEEEKNLSSFVKGNICTIYNPVRLDFTQNYNTNKNNSYIKFLFVGRLSHQKNLFFLLDIFDDFYKRYNRNIQLDIIGDGEMKEELINYKNKLDSGKQINFLGIKDNVAEYMYLSDFFIISSLYEGFPVVMIEAMSVGLPIIAHDFKTGAKEVVRNNDDFKKCVDIELHTNGVLVPYMNKNKFVEGINKVINHSFDKNKIIENSKKFNIDHVIKYWVNVIEK